MTNKIIYRNRPGTRNTLTITRPRSGLIKLSMRGPAKIRRTEDQKELMIKLPAGADVRIKNKIGQGKVRFAGSDSLVLAPNGMHRFTAGGALLEIPRTQDTLLFYIVPRPKNKAPHYGLGEYAGIGRYGWKPAGYQDTALRYWITQTARARDKGINGYPNALRVIISALAWLSKRAGLSLFAPAYGGKIDLLKLHETEALLFEADLHYALSLGITPHVDVFDEVALKGSRFFNTPWFADNNRQNLIRPGVPLPDYPADKQRTDPQNLFEHIVKADYGPVSKAKQEVLWTVWRNFLEIIPARCYVGNNELSGGGSGTGGRGMEKEIMSWHRNKHKYVINGAYLYSNLTQDEIDKGKTWVDRARIIAAGFPRAHVIRLHHIRTENWMDYKTRLALIIEAHPHVEILYDSDGAGSGWIRGENNRPLVPELARANTEIAALSGGLGKLDKPVGFADSLDVMEKAYAGIA